MWFSVVGSVEVEMRDRVRVRMRMMWGGGNVMEVGVVVLGWCPVSITVTEEGGGLVRAINYLKPQSQR